LSDFDVLAGYSLPSYKLLLPIATAKRQAARSAMVAARSSLMIRTAISETEADAHPLGRLPNKASA